MRYIINAELCELAIALRNRGFQGETEMSCTGCTGTEEQFGEPFVAMEVTGFCKETIYIAWDMDENDYILVGRYSIIDRMPAGEPPTVEDLTKIAWEMYKDYKKNKNWGRPIEWDPLFKELGYVTTKTVQKTVEVEKD